MSANKRLQFAPINPRWMEEGDFSMLPMPAQYVLDLAARIRLHLGIGGANFPGADELYAAAEKIEAWQRAQSKEPGGDESAA